MTTRNFRQEQIKQKLQELDTHILRLVSPMTFNPHEMSTLEEDKATLSRELRVLQSSQQRQRRFREKKKQQQKKDDEKHIAKHLPLHHLLHSSPIPALPGISASTTEIPSKIPPSAPPFNLPPLFLVQSNLVQPSVYPQQTSPISARSELQFLDFLQGN
eukprot:TRINITY_DN35552_c0_g1_i1.p1 TRINITY_DN35552_c0_g1~~TRINITY_DN35552_c0_g1_i1.p1  ORF type:complete len:177 (+),score=33.92 TRINITY_DN35552_c0_g1_i1:57-533(+)